jgi:hypothetical protein
MPLSEHPISPLRKCTAYEGVDLFLDPKTYHASVYYVQLKVILFFIINCLSSSDFCLNSLLANCAKPPGQRGKDKQRKGRWRSDGLIRRRCLHTPRLWAVTTMTWSFSTRCSSLHLSSFAGPVPHGTIILSKFDWRTACLTVCDYCSSKDQARRVRESQFTYFSKLFCRITNQFFCGLPLLYNPKYWTRHCLVVHVLTLLFPGIMPLR